MNRKKNKIHKQPVISPKRLLSLSPYPFPDETAILQIINIVHAGINIIGIIGLTFNPGKTQAIKKKPIPQINPRRKKDLYPGGLTSFFMDKRIGAFLARINRMTVKIRNPKYSAIPGI